MLLVSNDMRCCALQELDGLDGYTKPEDAMKAFCRHVMYNDRYTKRVASSMGGLYIFSGVEDLVERNDFEDEYDQEDYNIENDVRVGYASKFAELIKKENLGVLRRSPARANRLNHPTHIVRAWIWAPNEDNLVEWYKKNKGRQ